MIQQDRGHGGLWTALTCSAGILNPQDELWAARSPAMNARKETKGLQGDA